MSHRLARIVSVFGHPLVCLPVAALLLAAHQDAGPARLSALMLGSGAIALGVMGYSRWQVRRERWRHVDASGHGERRSLNRFLLAVFAVATLAAWAGAAQREFALGLALSALLIAVAMLSARWCKLSLHVAFAMYAAVLLVQLSWLACAAGIAFTAAVAWSRLALDRHAPRDLVAGAIAGLLAGLAFWRLSPAVAG
ncbi:phosphatase PAP2 family protein [Luteimonas soli]|uniref:Phosphatase PAP2 family protein n=1 Tax=Luteimonas soli TaxID=1648966 RepID=A0ABV7XLS3_9GAMM